MSLTVPRSLLKPDQPNSLKLVGKVTQLSHLWYGTGSLWNGVIERNSLS